MTQTANVAVGDCDS